MAMNTVTQVRLPNALVKEVDKFVKKGIYSSKSDVIRDALREFFYKKDEISKLVGMIPDNGIDSIKEVKSIRRKLSKDINSFEDIRKIDDEFS